MSHGSFAFGVMYVLLLVTVQPHGLSKDIHSSCWLPLAWEAYRLLLIDFVHVELLPRQFHADAA